MPRTDASAYDVDVLAWSRRQAVLLRAGRFDLADIEHLVEEIESLGSEQLHAVESALVVLLAHLLKLSVSTDGPPRRDWAITVREQRRQIERRLKRNPSIRRALPALAADAWEAAREAAIDGLRSEEENAVPMVSPFTAKQLLDPGFLPPRPL